MSKVAAGALVALGILALWPAAVAQDTRRRLLDPARRAPSGPRLEPVAETRLLMEAITRPNFRGMERLLREKPAGAEDWTFVRGQALLIAETGNLLMLRPPRREGRLEWMDRAVELRSAARRLAGMAADGDYEGRRAALAALAQTCDRCHRTFRVPVRIAPGAGSDGPARSGAALDNPRGRP